jgi:hypothetical protein
LLDHVAAGRDHGQEKPLSIALREVNAGKLICIDVDPEAADDADGGPVVRDLRLTSGAASSSTLSWSTPMVASSSA